MANSSSYTPINCSFYDIIEAHATNEDLVKIVLKNEGGNQIILEDQIKNLETRNGEEFVILRSGNIFRLDLILSVNGVSPGKPPFQ